LVAKNVPATIWARSAETVEEINTKHTNERYLPGARLTPALRATTSIEEAVRSADVVVMGVPSHARYGERSRQAYSGLGAGDQPFEGA
jgi:glycerol-3-phosphate dehydrogenase (NAD(P)+)